MANLIITFTRSSSNRAVPVPVVVGSLARSETVVITGGSDGDSVSTNAAEGAEAVAVLYAEAACWVTFGPTPTVEAGDGHYMPAETLREFAVATGDKVAVIEAA